MAAKKKAAPRKRAATKKPTTMKQAPEKADGGDRYRMIQEAAYFLAEKDGFRAGRELHYWLQAEDAIARRLEG